MHATAYDNEKRTAVCECIPNSSMIEKGDGRMVLCSRCKKRPAVVFITSQQGDKKRSEGLCMICAKELNVPQISEYMKHMGVTDEEL